MTPHVRLHVLKRLPADVTRPAAAAATGICFSVSSEMFEETICRLTTFPTDSTETLWLVGVRLHVFQQVSTLPKTPPTADAAVSCLLSATTTPSSFHPIRFFVTGGAVAALPLIVAPS